MDGIPLDKYTPGEAYDLSPALAEYLIVQGFAIFEMRTGKPRGLTRRILTAENEALTRRMSVAV
jgi:hypothetical protein